MTRPLYIITGPTASGKSDFAHTLAKRIGAVIINADSVQIYSGIENISASPLTGDLENVPYKLFSILPLTEQISVADYLKLAAAELEKLPDGQPAIFVGGTGFYINALINGISPMPEISPDTRRRAREQIAMDGSGDTDPQRAARRLEILLETGREIEYWQSQPRVGAVTTNHQPPTTILINPPREIINDRIAARIPKMITGGATYEAQNIIANGWPENRAIGSAQLCKFLRGDPSAHSAAEADRITMDECVANWTTKTAQYAKRQRTWFRTQLKPDIIIDHVPTEGDIDEHRII